MRFLFVLTLLLLNACSTVSKVTSVRDLPYLNKNSFGLALPIQVDTSEATFKESDCALVLRPKDSVKTFELDLVKGKDLIFAELPAGIYSFDGIVCGVRQWSLVPLHLANFEVFQGKISLLNGFSVFLSGRLNLNLEKSSRSQARSDALSFFGRLSEENKARVVSGYTAKAILASELEKSPRWKHWEQKDEHGELLKKPEKDWPSFHSCYAGEYEINPLWLGDLRIEAVYENGKLSQANTLASWNSFSDHFIQCAQDSLKSFQPKNQKRLTYLLYL